MRLSEINIVRDIFSDDIITHSLQSILHLISDSTPPNGPKLHPSPHNSVNLVNEAAFRLTPELREWLKLNEFPQEYAEALENHGYFNLHFIAGLKVEVSLVLELILSTFTSFLAYRIFKLLV